MFDLGKPVLSNYLKDTTYPYTAKGDKDYEIGNSRLKPVSLTITMPGYLIL